MVLARFTIKRMWRRLGSQRRTEFVGYSVPHQRSKSVFSTHPGNALQFRILQSPAIKGMGSSLSCTDNQQDFLFFLLFFLGALIFLDRNARLRGSLADKSVSR